MNTPLREGEVRVRRIFQTDAPGMYGWRDECETVASVADGIVAMDAPMKSRCYEVQVDVWDGKRWREVAKRNRIKKTRMVRESPR